VAPRTPADVRAVLGAVREPAEIAVDEPIVEAARAGIVEAGLPDAEPTGATYGADSRHYIAAGIPTVLLGPGSITEAHYPDETIAWDEVERGREAIAAAVGRFAGGLRRVRLEVVVGESASATRSPGSTFRFEARRLSST